MTGLDRSHLEDLIERAEESPDIEHDQPPGEYVTEAKDDFEGAGFDVESVPWAAIAMRAYELSEAEHEEQ